MGTYYLDASAVVKRYLREPGSNWVAELWERKEDIGLFSANLIDVEVVCALSRAHREGRIGVNRRNELAGAYILEAQLALDRIIVTEGILRNAHRLALRHPLRAYDAVHLATALDLAERLSWSDVPAPVFVSADENLLAAARAEGLVTENPNEHE